MCGPYMQWVDGRNRRSQRDIQHIPTLGGQGKSGAPQDQAVRHIWEPCARSEAESESSLGAVTGRGGEPGQGAGGQQAAGPNSARRRALEESRRGRRSRGGWVFLSKPGETVKKVSSPGEVGSDMGFKGAAGTWLRKTVEKGKEVIVPQVRGG